MTAATSWPQRPQPVRGGPGRPPMRSREFGELADTVAARCGRYGVPAWAEDDRDRLEAALWRFIHPDLAHGPADPYRDVEAD
jgi:hypothetical protein